jgi:hypothetical protein
MTKTMTQDEIVTLGETIRCILPGAEFVEIAGEWTLNLSIVDNGDDTFTVSTS